MDKQTERPIIILLHAVVEIARFAAGLLFVLSVMFGIIALAAFLGWQFQLFGGPIIGGIVILLAVRLIGRRGDPRNQKLPPDVP